jgi:dTDP-4-amino-4,6-dideoxygalactose transaminase
MWPRKQLDISWSDLAFGLRQVVTPGARPTTAAVIGAEWVPADEAVLALSVRSGLDLLLTALALPADSEVIVSAVTIPDMARIIKHHHLVAVPVDVDGSTVQPSLEHIERSITPRTRAILVAHLFGTHIDMGPIIELAQQHNLLVIEDCAQAFVGSAYAGHPDSDCALFSFGPIKTATALGGAVVRVRDAASRSRMQELQQAYPVQTRWAYFKRLVKYATFRFLCKPFNYGLVVRTLQTLGIDYDRALGNAAHSFAANDFFTQIRRRPCTPLLRMLERRVTAFERRGAARLWRRATRGHQLSQANEPGMVVGDENSSHSYWVVPVRVANREAVLAALREAGFDATSRSSLIVVPAADHAPTEDGPLASWLAETIFVPGGEDMPDDDWDRVIAIFLEVAFPVPARSRRAVPELCQVPMSL